MEENKLDGTLPLIHGWKQEVKSGPQEKLYRFQAERNGGPYMARVSFEEKDDGVIRVSGLVTRLQDDLPPMWVKLLEQNISGENHKKRAAELVVSLTEQINDLYFSQSKQ